MIPKIPPQYLALAFVIYTAIISGMFYNFGSTSEKLDCTDDKLNVAEEVIEVIEENIEEHDTDATEIREHHTGVEVVVAEATTEILNVESDHNPGDDSCAAGSNIRLQQAVYDKFPTEMFFQ